VKELYAKLYETMLAQIDCCNHARLSEKEKAEKCFSISRNHGKKLKDLIKESEFADESEEIDFFQNVKPQFASHIEYFLKVSEALSNVPGRKDAAIAFWQKEKERLQVFCQEHGSFVSYYNSGKDDFDMIYFLRVNNDLKFKPNLQIYDSDIDWCTSHDRLLRNYIAYMKFEEYCNNKISELIERANW